MITYHQLRTFLEVVRTRNLTKAARELNASQPTVSQQLRALRTALGATLLDRDDNGFRLTPAGERFRRYAEETLGGLRTVQQEIAALKGTPLGSLAVGLTFALGGHVLSAALFRFRAQCPGVELEVHLDRPEPLFRRIVAKTLDMVCYLRVRTPPGFTVESLGAEELVIIASPRHPLAGRRRITAKDLRDHKFIVPAEPLFRELLEAKLSALDVIPHSVIEAPNNDAVKRLVANNAGYSMYVKPRLATELATRQLVELRVEGPPIVGDIVAAFPSGPVVPPLVHELVRFLRTELAGDRQAAEQAPLAGSAAMTRSTSRRRLRS